jgi:hypothetical protein
MFIKYSHFSFVLAATVHGLPQPHGALSSVHSQKRWTEIVEGFGNRSRFKPRDLYKAEKAAYEAFEQRVEEMKREHLGVLPHDGNGIKMGLSMEIERLAFGDEAGFNARLREFEEKARHDPVLYSPMVHGLTAAKEVISHVPRVRKWGGASPRGEADSLHKS